MLDLRAFGLGGIAGTLPVSQVQSVAAFASSATGTADVSNKVVLVKNVDATVTSVEVHELGAIKLTGTYLPGTGTYVDGSFLTSNFLV